MPDDNVTRWIRHLDSRQKELERLLGQLVREVEELAGKRDGAIRRELAECGVDPAAIEHVIARGTLEMAVR